MRREETPRPVTDAFGTRLSPDYLLAGLRRELGADCRLMLDDDGAVLEVLRSQPPNPRLEPALLWLRERLIGLSVRLRVEDFLSGSPDRIRDERLITLKTCALSELPAAGTSYSDAVLGLLKRLGYARTNGRISRSKRPPSGDAARMIEALEAALPCFGLDPAGAGLWSLDKNGHCSAIRAGGQGPAFLLWRRPAERPGFRPGIFIAAAREEDTIFWLAEELKEFPGPASPTMRVLLDGLEWSVFRRPTLAVETPGKAPIVVDPGSCLRCGRCAGVCPANCLETGGTFRPGKMEACLSCFDCVEACAQDALRPAYTHTSAMRGEKLRLHPGWLSRLRGCPGGALPAGHPPSYLIPKKRRGAPRYVLGLAVMTLQEHAAVLLKNGRIVGAVEEEKLARIRHYGWPEPGADPIGFPIEESFCRRAIRALLSQEGITLDDVDVIAFNGLPFRYGAAYVNADPDTALPIIQSGRLMYIPHHQAHAASSYRVSGLKDAWVLTVDGRGERQTAAVFRASRSNLRQVYELRSLVWRSIGGVYESVTRLLGFGSHGQGIAMALASSGRPDIPMEPYLSWTAPDDLSISETVYDDLRHLARPPDAPIEPAHRNLAASLQNALEKTILNILGRFLPPAPDGLCLAGGVALNCRMNELIRRRLRPAAMFVQPAANDAGTALGAALEACARLIPKFKPFVMDDAYLGPRFTEKEIKAVLERSGMSVRRPDDLCRQAAKLLAEGNILAWFQGRAEFGPRALGARSILADPRRQDMKERVNLIKNRHPWRPFGPSILAGRENEWFDAPFDSRFMLFTMPVRKDKAGAIPAVLHDDGTTRPQSVHRKSNPLYHRLIVEFERLTGVPLLLNTSFNRKGEPIVTSPKDAVEAFREMDADALVIGPFIVVKNPPAPRPPAAKPSSLRSLRGGRRLALRVTTDCDIDCAHCTMRDIRGLPARDLAACLSALEAGRRAGCDELVLMRGEPALWPHIFELSERARGMGYRFIQVQTNGRSFSRPGLRERLLAAVDAAEVLILGADEATHDGLSGVRGSFRETLMGMKILLGAGKEVLPNVPVLRRNINRLEFVPELLGRLGARRIQFSFPRPVQMPRGVVTEPLVRLADAAQAVRRAARAASRRGLEVSTEGLPWCHLDEQFRAASESARQWDRFRIDDLQSFHDGFGSQIRESRPEPPACRACRARRQCPRTWPLYLEIFGSAELGALP